MITTEKLKLIYRGETLSEFTLGGRSLAVGRGENCDIVVHDPEVAEHHWLVVARKGTVVAYDLAHKRHRFASALHLPLDSPLPLGREYALARVPGSSADRSRSKEPPTALIEPATISCARFNLLVGNGGAARRFCIGGRPLHVGSGGDNDIVVADSAASRRHCRLEPGESGLVVRDLGSLNGTYVNGVRVVAAQVTGGSQIRVGRTDLRLVGNTEPVDGEADDRIVAESSGMLDVVADVERMAALSWPVLIRGDSGTGKERVARSLHHRGPRRRERFVALNAGGLPRELVESELFGHERGAFTGAVSAHKGAFEQASGGTLFLDEIGELPIEMQARLLRAIESREIRRVGGENEIQVDVRLVCATHRDLRSMAAEGRFRQDLYFRITRLMIDVPPLRTRLEDIRALADFFLHQIAPEVGPRRLTVSAVSRLTAYGWPGNARELCNVLSAACAATPSEQIDVADIERALSRVAGCGESNSVTPETIIRAIEEHNGNQSAAARALGISRSTLRDRMKLATSPASPNQAVRNW